MVNNAKLLNEEMVKYKVDVRSTVDSKNQHNFKGFQATKLTGSD